MSEQVAGVRDVTPLATPAAHSRGQRRRCRSWAAQARSTPLSTPPGQGARAAGGLAAGAALKPAHPASPRLAALCWLASPRSARHAQRLARPAGAVCTPYWTTELAVRRARGPRGSFYNCKARPLEDYVANFWCATNLLVKWKRLVPATTHSSSPTTSFLPVVWLRDRCAVAAAARSIFGI